MVKNVSLHENTNFIKMAKMQNMKNDQNVKMQNMKNDQK